MISVSTNGATDEPIGGERIRSGGVTGKKTPQGGAGTLSAAVVLADATTISLAAPAMSFKLTMGMSPF